MTTARANYRVSLFGGGTDYPEWYEENGGLVVNFALEADVLVEVQEEKDRVVVAMFGENYRRVKTRWSDGYGAGLGGSGAQAVALVAAMGKEIFGEMEEKETMVRRAFRLERRAGRIVGMQDQLAAAYGGCRVYRFEKGGEIGIEELVVKEEDLYRHFMLLPMGREFEGISGKYVGATNMQEVMQDAREGVELVRRGDWQGVGELVRRGWERKRRWVEGVSTKEVDRVVEMTLEAGAWGARMMGQGGGGTVLVVAESVKEVWERMLTMGYGAPPVHVYGLGRGVQ